MPKGRSDAQQKGADGKGPSGLPVFISPKRTHVCSWIMVRGHTVFVKNANNTGVKAVIKLHSKTYFFLTKCLLKLLMWIKCRVPTTAHSRGWLKKRQAKSAKRKSRIKPIKTVFPTSQQTPSHANWKLHKSVLKLCPQQTPSSLGFLVEISAVFWVSRVYLHKWMKI